MNRAKGEVKMVHQPTYCTRADLGSRLCPHGRYKLWLQGCLPLWHSKSPFTWIQSWAGGGAALLFSAWEFSSQWREKLPLPSSPLPLFAYGLIFGWSCEVPGAGFNNPDEFFPTHVILWFYEPYPNLTWSLTNAKISIWGCLRAELMASARFQVSERGQSPTLKLDLHIVVGVLIPSPAENKMQETGKQLICFGWMMESFHL